MTQAFSDRLNAVLAAIGEARLKYDAGETCFYADAFDRVDAYAASKGLINTAIALRVVRTLHGGMYRGRVTLKDGSQVKKPYLCHCLSVCRMLMNLPLPLEREEEDIMLAAALCHDVPAYAPETRVDDALTHVYKMDPRVSELVELIYTRDCVTDEDFAAVFRRVSGNRLALLIKLADRGNVVESLYDVSVWTAYGYIEETRNYYIPLSIHAREDYPELDRVLGVLQEKMRDLTEATEIFLMRYQDLERELTGKILQLEEDNARARTRIRKAKENKAAQAGE